MFTMAFGDGAAPTFDEIIDAYEKRVFNLVYRLIGDYEEAADLTQDTFVSAYRAYSRFRFECSVYTWLCRIAVNHCKNKYRERDKQRIYEDSSLDLTDDASLSVAAPDGASPGEQVERQELKERIADAIMSLPEEYRIVAVLRDLQGLSYQEIVEATELSMDNVKVRLSRARAMLRRKLAPYLDSTMP